MNLVQRMQIRINPNCIDNWDIEKLNREVVQYSMENGYNFNSEVVENLIEFASYRNKFKANLQFIQSFELNNESIYNNILIHKINQKNIAVSL